MRYRFEKSLKMRNQTSKQTNNGTIHKASVDIVLVLQGRTSHPSRFEKDNSAEEAPDVQEDQKSKATRDQVKQEEEQM